MASTGARMLETGGRAVPNLDLHFQDQVKHNAHSLEAKLPSEGGRGCAIPASILVIPQPWCWVVFILWLALTFFLAALTYTKDIPSLSERTISTKKARMGEYLSI